MNKQQKVNFYNSHKLVIHPKIKSDYRTKPLWRKLFWTTARDSDEYKIGCITIFIDYFPGLYKKLNKESNHKF